ncbi:hypothetical protein Ahy_A04g020285 [Arachis hypogaea]|uniref:Protein FAR1-RELATED SEQUENCE n=1 Tax=Arachis hypogaea TaxID=3818 RepID=A0A445DHC2_ARAHY|nr:hypothetical protein Ahy_A04g020285 [Arachis hypogaea]
MRKSQVWDCILILYSGHRNFIKLHSTDDNAGVKEMLKYFMRMKEINPNFYVIDVNGGYRFRSVLWVDARCRQGQIQKF